MAIGFVDDNLIISQFAGANQFPNSNNFSRAFDKSNDSEMAEDPQDVADCERIFKRCDANGDGRVSATELGEALKALGSVTAEEVTRMMMELDTDGDGFISFEEFTQFARTNRGLIRDVAKIF